MLGQRGEVRVNHDPISRTAPGGDATDRRTGVGGLLRASRLRCGEELEAVAQVLRIRPRHLQAIEEGHFDQLPGATYAVGFIRAYADYLGLDAEEVVRRFKDEQTIPAGRPPKADLVFPSPMSETGIPRGAVVFLGVVIGMIAYGAWYVSTVDNDFFKKWIEPVPARLAALLPGGAEGPAREAAPVRETPSAPAATPVPETAEAATSAPTLDAPVAASETPATPEQQPEAAPSDAPARAEPTQAEPTQAEKVEPAPAAAPEAVTETPDATPAPEPVTPEPTVETAHPPAAIAQPVETADLPAPASTSAPAAETATANAAEGATPATATPEPAATTQAAADARIVLKAVRDSWVEVRKQVTDEWVWGKLMRAGDTYAVPDRDDLKMKTGDAGGLEITVDGQAIPPIGASGEVVRNVVLDPERLKAGTAIPQ